MARVPDSQIVASARAHGIPVGVFRALVQQESGNQTGRVSPAGAFGPTQLMPATAAGLGVGPHSSTKQLLDAGARYFAAQLKGQGGNVENALRAYNAGPGAVQASHGYAETNHYVQTILANAKHLGDHAPTTSQPSMGERARANPTDSDGRAQAALDFLSRNRQTFDIAHAQDVDTPDARVEAFRNLDHGGNIVDFAMQIRGLRDADTMRPSLLSDPSLPRFQLPDSTDGGTPASGSPGGAHVPKGASGNIKITGPNPGRIQPQVRHFMGRIAGVLGETVVGSDGTGHSRLTTTGNVSEHFTGAASDIPATGAHLMKLGRAALIAAGMPRKQALSSPGGLYNVVRGGKRYQIIFGINDPARGGNHTDHLHVGVSGGH